MQFTVSAITLAVGFLLRGTQASLPYDLDKLENGPRAIPPPRHHPPPMIPSGSQNPLRPTGDGPWNSTYVPGPTGTGGLPLPTQTSSMEIMPTIPPNPFPIGDGARHPPFLPFPPAGAPPVGATTTTFTTRSSTPPLGTGNQPTPPAGTGNTGGNYPTAGGSSGFLTMTRPAAVPTYYYPGGQPPRRA